MDNDAEHLAHMQRVIHRQLEELSACSAGRFGCQPSARSLQSLRAAAWRSSSGI